MYSPGYLPPEAPSYLRRELAAISQGMVAPAPVLQLEVAHRAPDRPRDGMVLVADGTDWNPGSGAGVYARIGGAWVKL